MLARRRSLSILGLTTLAAVIGCGHDAAETLLQPPETFSWCAQPISFSPPSSRWRREAESSGGLQGVRFVLQGGGGQCVTVAAFRVLAERDRRAALQTLIRQADSLSRREFLDKVSLARARTDDPLSEEEAAAALAINAALDRAVSDYLSGTPRFASADLDEALQAASSYEPTLAELLPRVRLRPERMLEPGRWRLGYQRDTTIGDLAAFASDDTLITPERPLLYRQVFWVVNRCAFKVTYQGTPENLETFDRLVGSVQFPDSDRVAQR